jgi:hypothetical protein
MTVDNRPHIIYRGFPGQIFAIRGGKVQPFFLSLKTYQTIPIEYDGNGSFRKIREKLSVINFTIFSSFYS